MAINIQLEDPAPLDYATPPFPSLYWPINPPPGVPSYLYYATDIWRFTTYWTLLVYAGFHLAVAAFAMLMQLGKGKSNLQYIWIIPIIYILMAGVEALLAGSITGLIIGAVYNAGYFKMSTWIPFVWSIINVMVLVISSFSMQLGL